MSLESAFTIGYAGLANVTRQFAVVSQNIANASTPDYSAEVATQTNLSVDGLGGGVRTGVIGRAVDQQLQNDLFAQNAAVAGLRVRQSALQGIDSVQGQVGQGSDLASLLGKLQDAFSTLEGTPDDQIQQQSVVSSAQNLTAQINTLSDAYTTARQTAQDGLVADVATLNSTLSTVGSLSDQIIALKARGDSTADLENQRDASLDKLSTLLDTRFLEQPNGDVRVFTAGGLNLPVHAATPAFAINTANLAPTTFYPGGGVPGITFNGNDVTGALTGGSIGAKVTLRDGTLPAYQATLDEFSQTLSTRFAEQGLRLFTQADGTVPTPAGAPQPVQSGYIGYAATIQVNPSVKATPSLVRDGTDTIAGSATGASGFTPNPVDGPAGFTGLITRVLDFALGSSVQAGVAQAPPNTTGLGTIGNLTAGFASPADLAGFASAVVGAESQDSSLTTSQLTTEQSVQTSLQSRLTSQSGVSADQEMAQLVQLQNAYGANAKVMAAVQAMWTQFLQAI